MNGTNTAVVQAGAMQWMAGNVVATSGIKGVGDFFGKAIRGAVTKESAVKPEYKGSGILVLEPTYKHIILVDVEQWGSGITVEDGMFYACDGTVRQNLVSRRNLSSAALGNEGLFNLSLSGHGIAALESNVPEDELIAIELNNDELRIDGSMAVCWSSNLQFTVEMSTRSIVGSAVSGEGRPCPDESRCKNGQLGRRNNQMITTTALTTRSAVVEALFRTGLPGFSVNEG